ncbi:MAG: hypothetical protein HY074_05525, partial [Deltaproteobacteria bacterium]|nr:hypothetical protein [Deltaproteobacteria bacterium]
MPGKPRLLVLAGALLSMVGCAHPGKQSEGGWRPEFKVHRDVFANGLTVLFVED